MQNLLTADNLEVGIRLWRTQKTTWPLDFHNRFYRELHTLKSKGLTPDWWGVSVDYLWGWRAIRPLTKATIFERGLKRLSRLQTEYERVSQVSNEAYPNLESVNWECLAELYSVAFDIKEVHSPVFGSKLCHFLLPNAYPVFDRDVIGLYIRSYEDYWRFCKAQWTECDARSLLTERLKQEIGSDIVPYYPYTTKVTELCIIGSRH